MSKRERLLVEDLDIEQPLAKSLKPNAGDSVEEDTLKEELDEDAILALLEQNAEEVVVENLTSQTLKKIVLQLERKKRVNLEQRARFADAPEKFAESELELHEQLLKLKDLAAEPKLLLEFACSSSDSGSGSNNNAGGILILINLLAHVNTDIVIAALSVLQALTEPDNFQLGEEEEEEEEENKEENSTVSAARFAGALVDGNLCEMMVDGFLRIEEKQSDEDGQGVKDALNIVENLAELNPKKSVVGQNSFGCNKKFLNFLLRRIRSTENDENRTYAAEILFIILQTLSISSISNTSEADDNNTSLNQDQRKPSATRIIEDLNVIDKLLKAVAIYRKRSPEDTNEKEFTENVFSSLCQLLILNTNNTLNSNSNSSLKSDNTNTNNTNNNYVAQFARNQGIELMVRILNTGNYSARLALKVTDVACRESKENCNAFVNQLGLKPLFAFFMGQGMKKKEVAASEEYFK